MLQLSSPVRLTGICSSGASIGPGDPQSCPGKDQCPYRMVVEADKIVQADQPVVSPFRQRFAVEDPYGRTAVAERRRVRPADSPDRS